MTLAVNITGEKWNGITAIRTSESLHNGAIRWVFRCHCGTEFVTIPYRVKSGHTRSCGCHRFGIHNGRYTHGMSSTRLYQRYHGMVKRCTDPRHSMYHLYGGRGITVCERWLGEAGFSHFLSDMGHPKDGESLDRINNNLGYSPENCRWATPSQQGNNKRINPRITFNGKTLTVMEWSKLTGVKYRTLRTRLIESGWTPERALTTPSRQINDSYRLEGICW